MQNSAKTEREHIIVRTGISERSHVFHVQKQNQRQDINYLSRQPLESEVVQGEVVAYQISFVDEATDQIAKTALTI